MNPLFRNTLGRRTSASVEEPTRLRRFLLASALALGVPTGACTEDARTRSSEPLPDTAPDAAPDAAEDAQPDAAPDVVFEPIIDGNVRIQVLTPTLLRLEYAQDGTFEDRPSQTVGDPPRRSASFESSVQGDVLTVQTEALTLRYDRGSGPFTAENLRITVRRGQESIDVSPAWGDNEEVEEPLGGWMRDLDLVGERRPLRPGLLSRRGWRLLDDTATALLVDSAPGFAERPERTGDYQDGYFFGFGDDYRQALADLRHLVGPAPLLPRTALGVWFSRYYAYSAAEWQGLVDEFATRGIPLDVISVDTDWKRPAANNFCGSVNLVSGARPDDPCSWNGWDWNYDIFPDPDAFLRWVRERGIDVGLNIHPSINSGDPEMAIVESFGATPQPDVSTPSCRILQADLSNACLVFDLLDDAQIDAYFALHDPIAEAGVDFWWFDWCCERTGRSVPGLTADTWINRLYFDQHRLLGSRWPAFSRVGGAYGSLPDETGQLGVFADHRQAIHFTGDTCSTWELLAFAGEFTVAEGAAGLPYVSHDIGSFHGEFDEGAACSVLSSNPRMSDDMYVRWIQFGTFQPFDRLHSNHGDRLPWEYPGEAEEIASEYLRLRGRLVPHLYTLSREAHDLGLPMARALYLSWPEEEDAYAFPSQFTLGEDLLVATVATPGPEPSIDVWIPPGTWVHWFTGETVTGPQVRTVPVPLNEYPVYARAGSILPTQPDLGTSTRGPQDALVVKVWAGGDGAYALYEDEGQGFGYEQGRYRHTPITSATRNGCHVVTIGAAVGAAFPGALDERSWTVEWISADDPTQVLLNGEALPASRWEFDAARARTVVGTGVVAAASTTTVSFGATCDEGSR
jgi:hypothetical protein